MPGWVPVRDQVWRYFLRSGAQVRREPRGDIGGQPRRRPPKPPGRAAGVHSWGGDAADASHVLPGWHPVRDTRRRHAVSPRPEVRDHRRRAAQSEPRDRPEEPPDRPGHMHSCYGARAASLPRRDTLRDRPRRHAVPAGFQVRHHCAGHPGCQPRHRPQQAPGGPDHLHPGEPGAATRMFVHASASASRRGAERRRRGVAQDRRDRGHADTGVCHEPAVAHGAGGQLVHCAVHLGHPARRHPDAGHAWNRRVGRRSRCDGAVHVLQLSHGERVPRAGAGSAASSSRHGTEAGADAPAYSMFRCDVSFTL